VRAKKNEFSGFSFSSKKVALFHKSEVYTKFAVCERCRVVDMHFIRVDMHLSRDIHFRVVDMHLSRDGYALFACWIYTFRVLDIHFSRAGHALVTRWTCTCHAMDMHFLCGGHALFLKVHFGKKTRCCELRAHFAVALHLKNVEQKKVRGGGVPPLTCLLLRPSFKKFLFTENKKDRIHRFIANTQNHKRFFYFT
jgi:hypothetical protein